MAQPRQLCEALSVDSFFAALMEISSQFSSSWGLHRQILGENCHGGKGAVWGVGMARYVMEEGSLQRRREAGR